MIYLVFNELPQIAGQITRRVEVVAASSGVRLAIIKWHGPWRQYVFVPEQETLFNPTCLHEIATYTGR